MREVNTTKGQILYPELLSDTVVGQFQAFMLLQDNVLELEERKELLDTFTDEDDRELELYAINTDKLQLEIEKIKTLTDPIFHEIVEKLNSKDAFAIGSYPFEDYEKIVVGSNPITSFKFKDSLNEDIETTFIVTPVSELELQAKMFLDVVNKSGVKAPEFAKEMLDAGKTLMDVLDELSSEENEDLETKTRKLAQRKELTKYAKQLTNRQYDAIHHTISHLVVPQGQMYDPIKAQQRAESFKKLPTDIALGVRDFFYLAQEVSKLPTRNFLSETKTVAQPAQKGQYSPKISDG